MNVCSASEMRTKETWDVVRVPGCTSRDQHRSTMTMSHRSDRRRGPSLSAWLLKDVPLMGWMWSRWIGKQRFNLSHWRFQWSLVKCSHSGMSTGELSQRAVCTNTTPTVEQNRSSAWWIVQPKLQWVLLYFAISILGSRTGMSEAKPMHQLILCGPRLVSEYMCLGPPIFCNFSVHLAVAPPACSL